MRYCYYTSLTVLGLFAKGTVNKFSIIFLHVCFRLPTYQGQIINTHRHTSSFTERQHQRESQDGTRREAESFEHSGEGINPGVRMRGQGREYEGVWGAAPVIQQHGGVATIP